MFNIWCRGWWWICKTKSRRKTVNPRTSNLNDFGFILHEQFWANAWNDSKNEKISLTILCWKNLIRSFPNFRNSNDLNSSSTNRAKRRRLVLNSEYRTALGVRSWRFCRSLWICWGFAEWSCVWRAHFW